MQRQTTPGEVERIEGSRDFQRPWLFPLGGSFTNRADWYSTIADANLASSMTQPPSQKREQCLQLGNTGGAVQKNLVTSGVQWIVCDGGNDGAVDAYAANAVKIANNLAENSPVLRRARLQPSQMLAVLPRLCVTQFKLCDVAQSTRRTCILMPIASTYLSLPLIDLLYGGRFTHD